MGIRGVPVNTHMYSLQIMWPVTPLKFEPKSGVNGAVYCTMAWSLVCIERLD